MGALQTLNKSQISRSQKLSFKFFQLLLVNNHLCSLLVVIIDLFLLLYYLAKKGTRGSIKAGRMLVKAGKLTGRALDKVGDYLAKKIIAIAVPGMGIQDLQHLKDMGVPIPGYAYDRLKKSESTDKDEKSL